MKLVIKNILFCHIENKKLNIRKRLRELKILGKFIDIIITIDVNK
jgi:hypothetical protein